MNNKIHLTKEQEKLIHPYIEKDMRKLKSVSQNIFKKYKNVPQSKHDDFYSIANTQLMNAAMSYSPEKCDNFHAYLKTILNRKFISYVRDSTLDKRCNKHKEGDTWVVDEDIRLDQQMSEDADETIGDSIMGSKSAEDLYFEENVLADRIVKFKKRLNRKQLRVLALVESGCSKPGLIAKKTGYSASFVNDCLFAINNNANDIFSEWVKKNE